MERNVIVMVIGGGFWAGCIQSTEPTPNVEATDRPTEFVSVEATIVAQISALEATNDTTITAPTPSLTVTLAPIYLPSAETRRGAPKLDSREGRHGQVRKRSKNPWTR